MTPTTTSSPTRPRRRPGHRDPGVRAPSPRRVGLFVFGDAERSVDAPAFPSMELEQHRGYECSGDLWSPGYFRLMLTPETPGTLIASTESWETIGALTPLDLLHAEYRRRTRLVEAARTESLPE